MFADRLRDARKAKRYSQTEVSRNAWALPSRLLANGRPGVPPRTPRPWPAWLKFWIQQPMPCWACSKAPTACPRLWAATPSAAIPRALSPLWARCRAGYGALAFEEDYGKEYASVKDPQNYFYLVVKGDSMEPRISDGDLALVHRQSTLENGDLGVLVYGSDGEGTLKKYIQRGNSVILHPFNPAYEELVIKGEELDHLYIAGKVVETKAKW